MNWWRWVRNLRRANGDADEQALRRAIEQAVYRANKVADDVDKIPTPIDIRPRHGRRWHG